MGAGDQIRSQRQHGGVHIRFFADGGGVAQLAGHLGEDGFGAVTGGVVALRSAGQARQLQRLGGAMPGAKVLGGEVLIAVGAAGGARATSDLTQVTVHVGRAHRVRHAFGIQILKQLLPRQLLAVAHHTRHTRVVKRGLLHDPTFAAKTQRQRAAAQLRVAGAQGGQAIRAVGAGVFLVAHAQVSVQRLVIRLVPLLRAQEGASGGGAGSGARLRMVVSDRVPSPVVVVVPPEECGSTAMAASPRDYSPFDSW